LCAVAGGTVADLLERWLTNAAPGWWTSTLRRNRSIVERHLKPLLGHLAVNKLTTLDIDDLYRICCAPVELGVGHWRRARCIGCTRCRIGR
jgi:Phage integrase, N-terminal SAM-like domain